MRGALFIFLIALAGCNDPVKDAETELDMLRAANVSGAEICQGQQNVAKAMLKAHDSRYTAKKQVADQACINAELEKSVLSGR